MEKKNMPIFLITFTFIMVCVVSFFYLNSSTERIKEKRYDLVQADYLRKTLTYRNSGVLIERKGNFNINYNPTISRPEIVINGKIIFFWESYTYSIQVPNYNYKKWHINNYY